MNTARKLLMVIIISSLISLFLPTPIKLTWEKSYETMVFNTASGFLEEGMYSVYKDGFLYRPLGVREISYTEDKLKIRDLVETSPTGEMRYYSTFINESTGKIYEEEMSGWQYKKLAKSNSYNPVKFDLFFEEANAAVAILASTSPACVNATSLTYSFTVDPGSDLGLTVGVQMNSAAALPTVTYAGTALSEEVTENTTPPADTTSIFKMENPPTGANNVVVTGNNGTTNICSGAISWTGVDQADMISASNKNHSTSATASVTVTTASGEWIMDGMFTDSNKTLTVGADQTAQWNKTGASGLRIAASTQDGASGGVMSWTWTGSVEWGAVAASLRSSAGGYGGSLSTNAPTVVQSAKGATTGSNSANITVTLSSTPTPGNILVAAVSWNSTSGGVACTGTLTDPAGSTWTDFEDRCQDVGGGSGDGVRMAWHKVLPGDSTTWTWTNSTSERWSVVMWEVNGANVTNPIDRHSSNQAASCSSTIASPSLIPSTLSTLPLSFVTGDLNTVTFSSVSAGWSVDQEAPGDYHGSEGWHHTATSDTSTAQNITWTCSGSTFVSSAIALIKPVGRLTEVKVRGKVKIRGKVKFR